MGGTGLCVYAKRDVAAAIRGVEWDGLCVGRPRSTGARGNVCACVRVWDSSVCVVSSRLSSGRENVAVRCREYGELAEGLAFSGGGVLAQDYVFWAGDLNSRIEMGEAAVRERVAAQDYAGLLVRDQLRREQRAGAAFPGFQEAPLAFRPTSKCAAVGGEYVKCPAWRDRVLWRVGRCGGAECGTPDNVTCLHYTAHDVGGSDHRPVSGVFLVRVHEVDAEWRRSRRAALRRLVSSGGRAPCSSPAATAAAPPCLSVAPGRVDFGGVLCGESQVREVALHNGGERVVRWRAIPQCNGGKPWLRAEPRAGTLLPGERITVRLTAAATLATPPRGETLEGAVCFAEGGGGSGATVAATAERVPTCFGLSLDALVRRHRALRGGDGRPSSGRFAPGSIPLPLPKEVWRMVDHLYREGLGTPNLFARGGVSVADAAAARECLDTGASFAERGVSVHGVAGALLAFLGALPEPVVPRPLFAQCLEASASRAAAYAFATERLPPVHYSVFYYLMSFLREAVARRAENGLTPERAAAIFSDVLLRSLDKTCDPTVSSRGGVSCTTATMDRKAAFIMHFLIPSHED